jgi:hypothetical protein
MSDEPEPKPEEEPIPWWETDWFKEWERLVEQNGA